MAQIRRIYTVFFKYVVLLRLYPGITSLDDHSSLIHNLFINYLKPQRLATLRVAIYDDHRLMIIDNFWYVLFRKSPNQ